jgi:hypothetical protein
MDESRGLKLTRGTGVPLRTTALVAVALALGISLSLAVSTAPTPTASAANCPSQNGAYPPGADVVITPASPITGQQFTVAATSFPSSRQNVTVTVGATAQPSSTDGSGILAPVTFTAGPVGSYSVEITDKGSPAINCTVTFNVVAAPDEATTTTTTTTTTPPTTSTPATTTPVTTTPATTTPAATTTTVATATTTTAPPETTAPPTTASETTTTAPPPTTTLPAPPPTLAPAPPPEPIDPGQTVSDGNLGVVRSDEPASPPVVVADGLAPATPVQTSVRIPQRIAEVSLDAQAFSPTSSFDPAIFVSPAGDTSAVPVVGAPTPLFPADRESVGGLIFSSTKLEPTQLGFTPTEFVAALSGSPSYQALPDLDPNDPIVTGASNWLLMDVVVAGANPGSLVEVVWFSDPVRLGTDIVNANGQAAFQVAVPDTLITIGETDTLRIFAEYLLDESTTDAQGNSSFEVTLPDELRAIAESGAQLQLIVRGVGQDGDARVVSVELPTEDFATVEEATNWWWLLLLALIPVAVGIYLAIRRRSSNEDEASGTGDDNQLDPDSTGSTGAAPLDPPTNS